MTIVGDINVGNFKIGVIDVSINWRGDAQPPVNVVPDIGLGSPFPDTGPVFRPRVDPGSRGHTAPGSQPGTEHGPKGEIYAPGAQGRPFSQGSKETDSAIVAASKAYGLDINTMRGIASIESSMNPSSNYAAGTQYKGLYQIGRHEWATYGRGNIYSAQDNAFAAAKMLRDHSNWFKDRYGRDPTDTELYMMHQQGRGFYSRGAMTNIGGNPYPGMRGAQSHESFEAGWGRELARRKSGFAKHYASPSQDTAPLPEQPSGD